MAAPNNPRSVTVVMGLGLRSNPNLHRALSGPFRVRIEAWQRWGGVGQSFPGGPGSKRSRMFL